MLVLTTDNNVQFKIINGEEKIFIQSHYFSVPLEAIFWPAIPNPNTRTPVLYANGKR